MIIAQRRPMRSDATPQLELARNTSRFEKISGVAINAVESPKSFCRCVANSIDRVIGDKPGALEPTGVEHVANNPALEDRGERHLDVPVFRLLQPLVLDPDLRLLDEEADVDDR